MHPCIFTSAKSQRYDAAPRQKKGINSCVEIRIFVLRRKKMGNELALAVAATLKASSLS